MYPQAIQPRHPAEPRPTRTLRRPVPASSILLLDDRSGRRRRRSRPVLAGAGYTVTRSPTPTRPFGQVADHQLVIVDRRRRRAPGRPSTSAARSGRRRRWPRCRSCASRDRRRRGADPAPRGRRRRRHGPAVRRPRARGAGRGAAAALPALQGPRAGHLGRRPHGRAGAPDRRRLQPQGRRRDDDDRDQRRGRRGAKRPGPGRPAST